MLAIFFWLMREVKGFVGAGMRDLKRLYDSNDVYLGLAKGIFSQLARRGMGFGEGQVRPPMAFTLVVDLLLCEMLASGVGRVVAEQCIAALAFMDDLWSHNGTREDFIKAFSTMKS